MDIIVTHGYLLSGSGSNVYVQNLCRALVREGHSVYLICQDSSPLDHDFVNEWRLADSSGTKPLSDYRKTGLPGRCVVYRPDIGDLLPVYVYDDYPGWRVRTFLDLSDDELEDYLTLNVGALTSVLDETSAEAVVTNHSLPWPEIADRATTGRDIPYLCIVHGSCLQYVARRSGRYMEVARHGLAGARYIISPSPHGASTIIEDFPQMEGKTIALSGGVDTDLFSPDSLDLANLSSLNGGDGRGPKQSEALREILRAATTPEGLLEALKGISGSYDPRSHDEDAAAKIEAFTDGTRSVVIYVGKLIHSKGVHSLISAFARIRRDTNARLLVVGFGTFREALEGITISLSEGDTDSLANLRYLGRRLEGGSSEPLEHFEVDDELLQAARGIEEDIAFVGPLDHARLSRLLPAADVAVVPSIFPEIFGLVAAEFAASGVVPFVAGHSGLAEAGAIVGRDLPFDLRVEMEDFESSLASAVTRYLSLSGDERETHEHTVRKNSVDLLSWTTLARQVVDLTGS